MQRCTTRGGCRERPRRQPDCNALSPSGRGRTGRRHAGHGGAAGVLANSSGVRYRRFASTDWRLCECHKGVAGSLPQLHRRSESTLEGWDGEAVDQSHPALPFWNSLRYWLPEKSGPGKAYSYYRRVRKFHDSLAAEWGTQFPFAHDLNLPKDTKDLLPIKRMPEDVLEQLDYEDGFACQMVSNGQTWIPWCSEPRISELASQPTIKGRRVKSARHQGVYLKPESHLKKLADAI